jgi:DNA-directed RNA polymerase subunit H (RpoH/RPB5)
MSGLKVISEAPKEKEVAFQEDSEVDVPSLQRLKDTVNVFLRVNDFDISEEPDFRSFTEEEFIKYCQNSTDQEIISRFDELNIEENFRSSLSRRYTSTKKPENKIFIFFLPTSRQRTKVGVDAIKLFCRLVVLLGCNEGVIISEQSLSPSALEQLESSNVKSFCRENIYNIISYRDDMFINIVEHCLSPKVLQIYTGDEIEKFQKEENLNCRDFPKMMASDPIAKFYRAKPGDVIKMKRKTGNRDTLINEQIVFRIVKQTVKKK